MNQVLAQSQIARFMIIVLGVIAVVAAMYAASDFLNPIFLAVLFAVVFDIPRAWLVKRGMSQNRALAVTILGGLLIGVVFLIIIGNSFLSLTASLPNLEQQMESQLNELSTMLGQAGVEADQVKALTQDSQTNPISIITYVLEGIFSLLASIVLVLAYAIFLLIEVSGFPAKLNAAFKPSEPAYRYINTVTTSLRNFLVAQTKVSLATGASITVALLLLNVQFAVLWGVVAFLMNFVPYIGPILAAIPAVIMAFIQYGPSVTVLLVILAYLVINGIINYTIYPRVMSQGVDISMFMVLAGMVFWGWILGPVGFILSVPMSAVIKISLESYPASRWMAIMLGSGPEEVSDSDSN